MNGVRIDKADDSPMQRALKDAQRHRHKLYGRNDERKILQEAYRRIKTRPSEQQATLSASTRPGPHSELVVIHGAVGVGKSGLAHSIQSTVEEIDGGYFLVAEFDCIETPEPYQALVEALTDFAKSVACRGDDSAHYSNVLKEHGIVTWKGCECLLETIPSLYSLIENNVPEFQEQTHDDHRAAPRTEVPSMDEPEMQIYANSNFHSFKDALCTFVRAVASYEKPMVVLFENMHWANECSLDVIRALIEDQTIQGVLFVATYTGDADQALFTVPTDTSVRRTPLELPPLTEAVIHNMLSDVLQRSLQQTLPLASAVATQTQGNAHLVWEYLRLLHDDHVLDANPQNGTCDCVGDGVLRLDVTAWVKRAVEELSTVDQEHIKILSCLGVKMDGMLTPRLLSCDNHEFKEFVDRLAMYSLLLYDSSRQCWRFSHGVVKDMVYDLIPPSDKRLYHYRIGRKLWRMLDSDELNQYIFLVVDQLTFTVDFLTDEREKTAIAKLCLCAGVRALHLSSFATSIRYLERGIALLGPESWIESYDLCLDLNAATAEVATSLGRFERVDQAVGLVLSKAKCFDDTVRLQTTMVRALGSNARHADATKLGLQLFDRLGEPLPMRPNRLRLYWELYRLNRRLKSRSSESILRLPAMTNANKLVVMQLLNLMFYSAYMQHSAIIPLIGFRLVRLTLDYGLCAVSCVGFALYAGILCSHVGDIKEGLRMSHLSFSLYEKFDSKAWLARFSAIYFESVHGWEKPFHQCRRPLDYARRVGLESGDTEFALKCGLMSIYSRFDTERLPDLAVELDTIAQQMINHGHQTSLLLVASVHQMVHNLMVVSVGDPHMLKGKYFDDTVHATPSPGLLLTITLLHRSMLALSFCQYATAARYAKDARTFVSQFFGARSRGYSVYVCGLADVVDANESLQRRSAPYARKCSRLLRNYATTGEPLNFMDRHYLLEAELAALSKNTAEAFLFYNLAVAGAEKGKRFLQAAFANERTGRFLNRQGDDARAATFFRDAIRWYTDCGAMAKVLHLRNELNQLGTYSWEW